MGRLRKVLGSRRRLWLAVGVLFVGLLALCVWLIGTPPPRSIVLATGDPAGGFAALGRQYKERLDPMGLRIRLVESQGSLDNLERLKRGQADVAFVQGGTMGGVQASDGLVSLAAVDTQPLWVFVRRGVEVRSLRDLKGKRVGMGPAGSGNDLLSRSLLGRYGVTGESGTLVNQSLGEVGTDLVEGRLDAALVVSTCDAPVVRKLVESPGVKLVSPRGQAALVRYFPYLRQVVLPEGVLSPEKDLPAEDTALLAPVTVLVARESLHPRAVEQVLLAARAIHGPGNLVDEPGRFPALEASELPAHVAAVKFLSSGESLLSWLAPYWVVRLLWQAKLVLLPLVTLALPAWKLAPMLYAYHINRILRRHYTALRSVEEAIERTQDAAEVRRQLGLLEGLRKDLESLSRRLPAHLYRDIYDWRMHVALVRDEGLARLRRLEGSSTGLTPADGVGAPPAPPDGAGAGKPAG